MRRFSFLVEQARDCSRAITLVASARLQVARWHVLVVVHKRVRAAALGLGALVAALPRTHTEHRLDVIAIEIHLRIQTGALGWLGDALEEVDVPRLAVVVLGTRQRSDRWIATGIPFLGQSWSQDLGRDHAHLALTLASSLLEIAVGLAIGIAVDEGVGCAASSLLAGVAALFGKQQLHTLDIIAVVIGADFLSSALGIN